MSYFDSIRCHSCRAQIDPDAIGGRSGFNCPNCGEQLNPGDLFGLKDSFVGIDEDEGNDLSLEDLMRHDPAADPLQPQDPTPRRQASSRALHAERRANPSGKPIGALEMMQRMKKGE